MPRLNVRDLGPLPGDPGKHLLATDPAGWRVVADQGARTGRALPPTRRETALRLLYRLDDQSSKSLPEVPCRWQEARPIVLPTGSTVQLIEGIERHVCGEAGVTYVPSERTARNEIPELSYGFGILAGHEFLPVLPASAGRDRITEEALGVLSDMATNTPLPPPSAAPFPVLALVHERPLAMSPHWSLLMYSDLIGQDEVVEAVMRKEASLLIFWFGGLVDLEERAVVDSYVVVVVHNDGRTTKFDVLAPSFYGERWFPMVLPFAGFYDSVLHQLDAIRSVSVEAPAQRARRKKRRGGRRWRPERQDFYELSLKTTVRPARPAQASRSGAGPDTARRRAHDVRAHWRVRVQRSEEPLTEAHRRLLERRGYTVYTDGAPLRVVEVEYDGETYYADHEALLFERTHLQPYRRGEEWIAVLASRVPVHVRGEGELVKATRVAIMPD